MPFNLSAGFSEMGKGIAQTAQAWTLEAQKAEAEKEKLKLVQEFTSGENMKQRDFTKGERVESQAWQGGEKDKDRSLQEKLSEAQRQASIAVASISAGASMANARLSADVQREGHKIQREALTPSEVRTAEWFAKAGSEERQAFQDVLIAKLPPQKAPDGYRKTDTGLEAIPGGPADPTAPKARDVPSGYRPGIDGRLEAIPGGPEDLEVKKKKAEATRAENEKAIPTSVTKGMQENLTALKQIDRTLTELDKKPGSVGGIGSTISSAVPGAGNLQNRWGDPEGTQLRALVADIGSLKIHDRSGAAVSASEFPRLKPFIPTISDDPKTVRDKLANFRAEYESALQDTTSYYSKENGFRPYTPAEEYLRGGGQIPAAPTTIPPIEKRAIGRTYQTPTGPAIWMGNGWFRQPQAQ